jgi:hypothetical protein
MGIEVPKVWKGEDSGNADAMVMVLAVSSSLRDGIGDVP